VGGLVKAGGHGTRPGPVNNCEEALSNLYLCQGPNDEGCRFEDRSLTFRRRIRGEEERLSHEGLKGLASYETFLGGESDKDSRGQTDSQAR